MTNKTIIYSPNYRNWGGGDIYIEQLCNYMNDHELETYILTAEPEMFSCPTKKMENVVSKKRRLLSAVKIAKEYKNEGFHTIILNDLSSLWLAPVFKFYGYRVLSLLHLYLQRRSENPLGYTEVQYQLLIFSAKFCDKVFSVNKNNQNIFRKNKVKFIGNYVPDWFFESKKHENAKQFDFVMIARLVKQKNIPLFLDILTELNKRTKKYYTALIVGEGPERENIINTVSKKGLSKSVKILDWVERQELPSVYDLGKCFVISSLHEGFATTLLEAHARGLPAIATRSSGFCGEFIEGYDDTTGIVFTSEDIEDPVFYTNLSGLIDEYELYENKCLKKARVFSQENVLNPILVAVRDSKSW